MDSFQDERKKMVSNQIEARGITDERLLNAMLKVPRHLFVPEDAQPLAYRDSPVRIGSGQTISQPYIVALMTSLLDVEKGDKVLDVGTGSGYQAAILAEMGAKVHSIERHPELAQQAEKLLHSLGYDSVQVHVGDGSQGLGAFAPYDRILVAAAAPEIPQPLLNQLADGGILVIPVGNRTSQRLEVWERLDDDYQRRGHIPVMFVPLVGQHGWRNS